MRFDEEDEHEILCFEGLNGFQLFMKVEEWRVFPEYTGDDGVKLVAFGSCGSQFEMIYNPHSLVLR